MSRSSTGCICYLCVVNLIDSKPTLNGVSAISTTILKDIFPSILSISLSTDIYLSITVSSIYKGFKASKSKNFPNTSGSGHFQWDLSKTWICEIVHDVKYFFTLLWYHQCCLGDWTALVLKSRWKIRMKVFIYTVLSLAPGGVVSSVIQSKNFIFVLCSFHVVKIH